MKRVIVLGIILLSISSLALAENSQPFDSNPRAYSTKIGSYRITIVTPLDAKRSVLVGVQEEGQKERDSYLVEGMVALAVSRFSKIAFSVDNSESANKYAKKMIEARALTMKVYD